MTVGMEFVMPNMTNTIQITGCQFAIKPPGWSYPRHHHHLFELLYCYEGEVTQSSEDQEIILRAGELILLRPGIKHHTFNHSDEPYRFFNFHFNLDDRELRPLLTQHSVYHLEQQQLTDTAIFQHIQSLEQLLRKQNPQYSRSWEVGLVDEDMVNVHTVKVDKGTIPLQLSGIDRLYFHHQLLLLIQEVALLLMTKIEQEEQKEIKISQLHADIAHEMEAMLQQNVHSKGAIQQIANKQNISRSQCYKIFMHVYGCSPRQYLSELKLNKAKELLMSSNLSIEAISDQIGFSSASHFSRQFSRWTGQSPNQYRPQHVTIVDNDK
ncbi:helix-turn-helix domain-containing protein [Paenibacillus yanchengensis]|uniref:Helix-turn-helix domain-containing protein n=1 Tax=Paenibacillus yanchengensis TaxID=2035833 RepID=A0ABW4YG38_9BACL